MKQWKKKRSILLLTVFVLLVGAAVFFLCGKQEEKKVTYKEFYQLLQEGQIESVVIGTQEMTFFRNGSDTPFVTDYPYRDSFIEELLLLGVTVEQQTNWEDVFYQIFDIFTSILLVGVVIFAGFKFFNPFEFAPVKETTKGFDDVVGFTQIKEEMFQIVNYMKHPELMKKDGVRQPKGVILSGAPGNGKTLFAKALAKEAGVNFIATRATDFESMFMAVGPAKVKKLFKTARKCAPCIIFIDEFDGIGTRRSYSGSGIETENVRIVTALLNELDGFYEKDRILVLAATNNWKVLDKALIRPGRFDKHFTIGVPEYEDRVLQIKRCLKDKKADGSIRAEVLAQWMNGWSFAAIESFLNEAVLYGKREGEKELSEKLLMSLLEEQAKK